MASQEKGRSWNMYQSSEEVNVDTTTDQAHRTNEWLQNRYDEGGEKEQSDLYGYEGPEDEEEI